MKMKPITPKLMASPQITSADLDAIAARGFTTLIDNRPDGEAEGQPTSGELAAAARQRGLAFHYLPIRPGQVTPEAAQSFGAIVAVAPGPVLAFCRSGSRSEALWTAFAGDQPAKGAGAEVAHPISTGASAAAGDRRAAPSRNGSGHDLEVEWVLETHVHADHLSAAPYIKEKLGGRIGIGAQVRAVQAIFKRIFNPEPGFATDGSQFDHLFADGEAFPIGKLTARALHTPGHTPADLTYLVGDAAFVGDTLFMPDYGTARADFPGGDAGVLYRSIRRILELPAETRLFTCHDYKVAGRDYYAWESTVGEQRARNIHVHDGISEPEFVTMRNARDATLDMPTLILPSVQVNMRAGRLPPPEANGISYLKLPVNAL